MTAELNEKIKLAYSILDEVQREREKERQEQEDKERGYKIVEQATLDRDSFKTCREAAKMCILSEGKLRELCRNRKNNNFPCIVIGKTSYVEINRVNEWLVAHLGEEI